MPQLSDAPATAPESYGTVHEGTACAKLIYAGSQRVAMVQVSDGATSYFHGDHLGSTSVVTDGTGTEEERNSYQPYGDLQTHTGTSDVAYKYTGQERDASTGVYFYNARYYDPVLGRFLSPDTLVQNPLDPQALNRYAYARNNPLRYTDPSGHFFKSIFKFFKRISHGVNKFMHRALGKAAPIVMTAVAVVASVYTFGAASAAAKGAFLKATTAGLTSQAAIGTKVMAMSGVVGSTAGGLAAGFVGGFVGSGGDLGSGLIGSAGGGLGGLATGLGSLAGAKYGGLTGGAVRVAGRGVAGGTTSALRGGRFEHGFGFAAGVESLALAAVEMRKSMIAQSTGRNATGTSVGFNGDGFKLGGARCYADGSGCPISYLGGSQGKQGFLFDVPYAPGSYEDLLVETYAGPHDFLNSFYHYNAEGYAYNYSGLARGFGEVLNGLNVMVATPFAAASVVPRVADPVLLSR